MDTCLTRLLEKALLEYVERYGVTEMARSALIALGRRACIEGALPYPGVEDGHA